MRPDAGIIKFYGEIGPFQVVEPAIGHDGQQADSCSTKLTDLSNPSLGRFAGASLLSISCVSVTFSPSIVSGTWVTTSVILWCVARGAGSQSVCLSDLRNVEGCASLRERECSPAAKTRAQKDATRREKERPKAASRARVYLPASLHDTLDA